MTYPTPDSYLRPMFAPGGTIDPHLHSFEEGFYILSGEDLGPMED